MHQLGFRNENGADVLASSRSSSPATRTRASPVLPVSGGVQAEWLVGRARAHGRTAATAQVVVHIASRLGDQ
jgi:hypothetical protein